MDNHVRAIIAMAASSTVLPVMAGADAFVLDWMAVGRWTVFALCAVALARPLCVGLRAVARLAVPALFAFLLLSLCMFATTPNGGAPTREEKERIRAALAAADAERAALGSLLTGGTRSGGVTNAASAFAFTMVAKETNRVDLAAAWNPEYVFSAVGLYHSRWLESNDWARIGLRTDVAGETNCAWTITDPAVVTNMAGFFGARGFLPSDDTDADGVPATRELALGLDPDLSDSDGDLLSDGEELGYAEVLSGDGFLWLDSSNGAPGVSQYTPIGGDLGWLWLDDDSVAIQGTECADFEAHKDGFFYISRDGNDVWTTHMEWSEGSDLRHDARSGGAVVVAALNWDMAYGGPGCRSLAVVETNGTRYVVYRAQSQDALMPGLYGPHSATYEVIVPFDETNTVYVSYLEVDESVAALGMDLGVQCPSMRSAISTNELYTIPAPPGALRPRTTVKYVLGRNTDPRLADTDGDGIPDGYSPVFAFDADGDGLADSLDPEPAIYGGDFHGQSDAWVQATFTNAAEILSVGYPQWVDAQVGVGLTNGLYKLTVTVPEVSGEATLLAVGDYSVVVTNEGDYVFLLEKGLRYSIGFSDVPSGVTYSCDDGPADVGGGGMLRSPIGSSVYTVSITVSYPDEDPVELVEPTDGEEGYVLYSPCLSIAPSGLLDPTFPVTMTADVFDIPAGLIPSVVWESGGETLSSWEYLTLTGEEDFDNRVIVVTATCRDAVLQGTVTIERHVRASSISLSGGGVIIVEGAYTNAPGEVVSASSTSAALDVSWALAAPGSLRLSSDCAGVVATNSSGTVFHLPRSWRGAADEEGDMQLFLCSPDATGQSGTFTLRFTPDNGGQVLTQTASLQVVKIRVEAEALWPSNRVRHVFGPKERFTITSNPQVELSVSEDSHASVSGMTVTAPDRGGAFEVGLSMGGFNLKVPFSCIPPSGIEATSCRSACLQDWRVNNILEPLAGEVAVGMVSQCRILPVYVSFSGLFFQEGSCIATDRWGLFSGQTNYLAPHDSSTGAFGEVPVGLHNELPDDFASASFGIVPEIPQDGGFAYAITNYWYVKKQGVAGLMHPFSVSPQEYVLETCGDLSVTKYGWTVTRGTNNVANVIRGM